MSLKSGGHRHKQGSIRESGSILIDLPVTLDRFRDAVGFPWRPAQLIVLLETTNRK